MLTSLLAVCGLLALRLGIPLLAMLLLSEALHYMETRWNIHGRLA